MTTKQVRECDKCNREIPKSSAFYSVLIEFHSVGMGTRSKMHDVCCACGLLNSDISQFREAELVMAK